MKKLLWVILVFNFFAFGCEQKKNDEPVFEEIKMEDMDGPETVYNGIF